MADEIESLLNEIDGLSIDDLGEEELAKLSEKIQAVRVKTNPYATKIDVAHDQQLLFMFTPMYRDFLSKLLMTANIGYLNRTCDEWEVPANVPVVAAEDYIDNPSLLADPEPVNDTTPVDSEMLKNYRKAREQMKKKIIVKEFLEHVFQYNPDKHVRSAYKPNPNDPERRPVITPASKMAVYMEKKRLMGDKNSTNDDKKDAQHLFWLHMD